jgi:hypothetical protein
VGALRVGAASEVLLDGADSLVLAFATESASVTDPLSAPEIDESSGLFGGTEGTVRFGSSGTLFVVALAGAEWPEVEPASGSGVEARGRSEPQGGGEPRIRSGLGAESAGRVVMAGVAGVEGEAGVAGVEVVAGPEGVEIEAGVAGVDAGLGVATWVPWDGDAFEASGCAEAWRSAPGSAVAAPSPTSAGAAADAAAPAGAPAASADTAPAGAGAPATAADAAPAPVAASGPAVATGPAASAADRAGVLVAAEAVPVAATGASVAAALGGTAAPEPLADVASSGGGEPGGVEPLRGVTRTRAGVPM